MPNTISEPDFWEAMTHVREVLKWAHNREPQVDAWALRQAFITALRFMEYHAVQQAVAPSQIATFDALARQRATEVLAELLKREFFT